MYLLNTQIGMHQNLDLVENLIITDIKSLVFCLKWNTQLKRMHEVEQYVKESQEK